MHNNNPDKNNPLFTLKGEGIQELINLARTHGILPEEERETPVEKPKPRVKEYQEMNDAPPFDLFGSLMSGLIQKPSDLLESFNSDKLQFTIDNKSPLTDLLRVLPLSENFMQSILKNDVKEREEAKTLAEEDEAVRAWLEEQKETTSTSLNKEKATISSPFEMFLNLLDELLPAAPTQTEQALDNEESTEDEVCLCDEQYNNCENQDYNNESGISVVYVVNHMSPSESEIHVDLMGAVVEGITRDKESISINLKRDLNPNVLTNLKSGRFTEEITWDALGFQKDERSLKELHLSAVQNNHKAVHSGKSDIVISLTLP